MDELKRCPFCNSDNVYCSSWIFTVAGIRLYANCPDCKTSFEVLEHVYNTRPIEDELMAEIERLKSALTEAGIKLEAGWSTLALQDIDDALKGCN